MRRLLVWGILVALVFPAAPAQAGMANGDLCAAAIQEVERARRLPTGLLTAVAFAESGRRDPARKRAVAWPWTVNNAGDGRYFASKAEAIAHVEALRRDGRRNIDVGCMQINLMHHPDAFADLDEAFQPERNVGYGADFLRRLHQETGSWARAVERYHTADAARGQAYRERVYDRWQDVRLAEAVEGAPERERRVVRGLAAPPTYPQRAAAAPAPPMLAQRQAADALARRGYLPLSRAPTRVAVLRPGGVRKAYGAVGADGRIAGSRLRIGPQRRGAAAPAPAAGPAATDAGAAPARLRRLVARRSG